MCTMHTDNQLEIIIRKFLKYLESTNPSFCFRNFLGVETFFFTSRPYRITSKLWRRTGLTAGINLLTTFIFHSSYVCGAVY